MEEQQRQAAAAARVTRGFAETFGRAPRWMAAAPGRVNVIGEHLDYNDGFVLPMAIDRYTYVAAAASEHSPSGPARLTVASRQADARVEITPGDPLAKGEQSWSNYPRGVWELCTNLGWQLPSLDLFVDSDVPLGSGLSSSAALEVATATLLEQIAGQQLEPWQKIKLCQQAEHQYARVPCGIMDQFASAMGQADHLLLLDCRELTWEPIHCVNNQLVWLIINTNVQHALGSTEYATRRAQCEAACRALHVESLREGTLELLRQREADIDALVFRRARHVVSETARTVQAAVDVREQRWTEVGQAMFASHASLRDDYEVSCRELDLLVQFAEELGESRGVLGSRMTGGGFGGCTISLVRDAELAAVTEHITARYHDATGITPTSFATRPARGAHGLQVGVV